MTNDVLQDVLRKHKLWLNHKDDVSGCGKCADLSYARLVDADLRGADLRHAILFAAELDHADLRLARLNHADLRGVNFNHADLRGADLDFSCLPLWCGSLTAHFDDRQLKQIAYHLVHAGLQSKNASPETKRELAKLIDFANGFHRVEECEKIPPYEEDEHDKR